MTSPELRDPKAITGRTVLVWLLGFFAVVFAANAVFIYLALGSFPGVVVESSYEAGQSYNQELAAARAQEGLNWQISARLVRTEGTGAQVEVDAADANGAPLSGLTLTVKLSHPASETGAISETLAANGTGRYLVDLDNVSAGNWNMVLEIEQNGIRRFRSENRLFLKD